MTIFEQTLSARHPITPREIVRHCIVPTPNTQIERTDKQDVSSYGLKIMCLTNETLFKGDITKWVLIQPGYTAEGRKIAVKVRHSSSNPLDEVKIESKAQQKMLKSGLKKHLIPSDLFVSQTADRKSVDIRVQSKFIDGTMTIDIDYSLLNVNGVKELLRFNTDFLKALLIDKVTIEPGLSFRTDNMFYRLLMQIFCVSPFFSQNILFSNKEQKFYIVDPGHDMDVENWDKKSILGSDLWKAKVIAMNMLGLGICGSLAVYGKIMNGKI